MFRYMVAEVPFVEELTEFRAVLLPKPMIKQAIFKISSEHDCVIKEFRFQERDEIDRDFFIGFLFLRFSMTLFQERRST